MVKLSADAQLMDALSEFYAKPLEYVMFNFPWDTDASIQIIELRGDYATRFPNSVYGPDIWACEFLDQLGEEIRKRGFDGRNSVAPIRFSTASGHGIGKSTLSAWLIKFLMDTRPFCKGTVTAVTADQLKAKTWSELGKWHNMSLTKHLFDYNTGRGAMSLSHKEHPQRWRVDAQTCKEENSEAFAGQHSVSSSSFYLFDEASGIPEKIYEVREGGLTDGEPMVFDFGNPTRNSGRFFDNCIGRFKHRFITRSIDSRDVAITNKELFQEMIDDYGEEDDIVKVRVRGLFPSAGSAQFISNGDVDLCQSRELGGNENIPLILGVDVARQGNDESVIYPRQGNDARSFPVFRGSGLDGVRLAGKIIEIQNMYEAQGHEVVVFIDAGGGYGGSPLDHMRYLGYAPIDVHPGRLPTDTSTYALKADEMWGKMKEAIHGQLCLPDRLDRTGQMLKNQLTQREFGHTTAEKIKLEPKKKLRDRGLPSPDVADALAFTYAEDVASIRTPVGAAARNTKAQSDYDPLEETW